MGDPARSSERPWSPADEPGYAHVARWPYLRRESREFWATVSLLQRRTGGPLEGTLEELPSAEQVRARRGLAQPHRLHVRGRADGQRCLRFEGDQPPLGVVTEEEPDPVPAAPPAAPGPSETATPAPTDRPPSLVEQYRKATGKGNANGNPNPVTQSPSSQEASEQSHPVTPSKSKVKSKSGAPNTDTGPWNVAAAIDEALPTIGSEPGAQEVYKRVERELRQAVPDVSKDAIRRIADLVDEGLHVSVITKAIRDFRELDDKNAASGKPTGNPAGLLMNCIEKRVRASGYQLLVVSRAGTAEPRTLNPEL